MTMMEPKQVLPLEGSLYALLKFGLRAIPSRKGSTYMVDCLCAECVLIHVSPVVVMVETRGVRGGRRGRPRGRGRRGGRATPVESDARTPVQEEVVVEDVVIEDEGRAEIPEQ